MGIEAAFEVADVAVLLRVHLVVGKDKLHIVEQELHGGLRVLVAGFRWSRLGFEGELSRSSWDERLDRQTGASQFRCSFQARHSLSIALCP